ncbi:hypothetical protein C8Q75DRAFT_144537 [Abortiporus biennis]|nr:hypothetical protein C8Q75DRAFT_144537 [Abortiporus biennis]
MCYIFPFPSLYLQIQCINLTTFTPFLLFSSFILLVFTSRLLLNDGRVPSFLPDIVHDVGNSSTSFVFTAGPFIASVTDLQCPTLGPMVFCISMLQCLVNSQYYHIYIPLSSIYGLFSSFCFYTAGFRSVNVTSLHGVAFLPFGTGHWEANIAVLSRPVILYHTQ